MRKAFAVTLLIFAASSLAVSQTKPTRVDYLPPAVDSSHARPTNGVAPAANPRKIKVYLVKVGDAGKSGEKIGCDDSLVAVTHEVPWAVAPLKAALEALVATPNESGDKLENFVFGPDLKVKSVLIVRGTAIIRFSGGISIAGVCDNPRITEQIHRTARQFPTVKRVRVSVGDSTLEDALR